MLSTADKGCSSQIAIKAIASQSWSGVHTGEATFHIFSDHSQLTQLSLLWQADPALHSWVLSELKEKSLDNLLFTANGHRHYLLYQKPVEGGCSVAARKKVRKVIEQILATSEAIKASHIALNFLNDDQTILAHAHYFLRYLTYQYTKKGKTQEPALREISVISGTTLDSEKLDFIVELTRAKNEARQLVNMRADEFTPNFMVGYAKKFAEEHSLRFIAFSGDELLQEGLGLIYAVGKGAAHPPAMVAIEYFGDTDSVSGAQLSPLIALVGKGITFDTGGVNLKQTGFVEEMFADKAGACAVFAAFKAAVRLGIKRNLVLCLPLAENSCSGHAYRPSDIIKSHKGLTVEITNTDAEGRLVLADAMSWVQSKYKVQRLIELSTLTGACAIALRDRFAGLFSNNSGLIAELRTAGEAFGEDLWHMPLSDEIKLGLSGGVSDLVNSTGTRFGGAIEAAEFLHYFVEKDVEWAHLDIAGMALDKELKQHRSNKSLASGFGVGTVLNLIAK